MVKVAILNERNSYKLQEKINEFIEENKIEIVDIKFNVDYIFYAMIIYKEKQ